MGITSYKPGSQIAFFYIERSSVFDGVFFFLCLSCLPKMDFYAFSMGLYCQIPVRIITIYKKILVCRSIQGLYFVELISLNVQRSPIFQSLVLLCHSSLHRCLSPRVRQFLLFWSRVIMGSN